MAAQNNNWKNTQASSSVTLKSTTGNGGATSGRKTEHKKAMRETVAKAAESKKNVGFDFKTAQVAQAKHEKSFRDFTDRKLGGKERVAAFVETLNPNKDWNIWKSIEPKTDADGYVSPGEAFKATDANWQRVNRKAQGIFAKMAQCNPDHTLLAIHYDTEEDFRAAYAAKKSEYEQLKKEYDSITPLVNYWARERAELSDKQRTPDYYEKYAGADANKQTYVDGVHQKLYQDSTELVQGVPFLVNSNGYANIVETVFNKGKELLEDKELENFSDRIGRVLMMTEDERQTYNYYYSRGDYDAAEKYLKVLETRLNDAWGAFKASAYMNNPEHSNLKKATHAIVTNAKAGVRDFNVSVKQAAKTVALGNILPEQRRVYESEAEALAGYSHPAVGFLSNTARSVGNMVPSIMANTIAPGSGIFAQTVSAGAQNYRSERLKGTSHEKASLYGAGTAIITLLTEGMFNGVSSLGSGAITRVFGEQADDILTKAITKVAQSPKAQARIKTILELAGNSSSEMLEEVFEAEADTLFRNVLFDENGNLNPFSAEKFEQGLQGALASLALNLLGVSGKHRANIAEFKDIAQQRAIDAAVDVAMRKTGSTAMSDAALKAQYDNALQASVDVAFGTNTSGGVDNKYAVILGSAATKYGNIQDDTTLPADTNISPDFSGTVAVDRPLTPNVQKVAVYIQKKLGIKVGYAQKYTNGALDTAYGGHWDPNTQTMYFNPGVTGRNMLFGVVMHEATHPTEATDAYKQLAQYVLNRKYGGEDTDAYKNALVEKRKNYQARLPGGTFTDSQARAELVAEQVAEILSYSEAKVRSVVDADYTLGQRIRDWLRETVRFWSIKLGSDAEAKQLLKDFRTVERYFNDALRQAKDNISTNGDSQYKIVVMPDGKKYVEADREKLLRETVDERAEELESRIKNEILGGGHVVVTGDDGSSFFITSRTAWKLRYRDEVLRKGGIKSRLTNEEYDAKLNAGLHIDEIIAISKENGTSGDRKNHNFAKDGFSYRTAYYKDYDGTYYKLQVSVGKSGEVSTVYNVGSMKKAPLSNMAQRPSARGKTSSNRNHDAYVSNSNIRNDESQAEFYGETDFERAFRLAEEKKNAKNTKSNQNVFVRDSEGERFQKHVDAHYYVLGGKLKTAVEKANQKAKADGHFAPAKSDANAKSAKELDCIKDIIDDKDVPAFSEIPAGAARAIKGTRFHATLSLSMALDRYAGKNSKLREVLRNAIEKVYWNAVSQHSSRFKKAVTEYNVFLEKVGIEPGSPESAAAQWYGEGFRSEEVKDVLSGETIVKNKPYGLGKLKKEFPDTWQQIAELSRKNRAMYDTYLDELNAMLEKIYPDPEGQIREEMRRLRDRANGIRQRAELAQVKAEGLQADIDATERLLQRLYAQRESGSNVRQAVDATDAQAAKKRTEFDALKRKDTKKAATIERQIASANNKKIQIEQEGAAALDNAIKRHEARLNGLRKKLEAQEAAMSDEARAANAREAELLEEEIKRFEDGLATGDLIRTKRVLPRANYYHHLREITTVSKSLGNLLRTNIEISPQLVGVSDDTKPKTKWAGFMQEQGRINLTADAAGAMLEYIEDAEYKLAFDPVIAKMRAITKSVAFDTDAVGQTNANGFIEYLTEWANALAGKTNFLDRGPQKIFGRTSTVILNALNGRAKSNTLLFSARNFVAQFLNLPNLSLHVQNPYYWGVGFKETLKLMWNPDTTESEIQNSGFMNERYLEEAVNQFDKTISTPKRMALWMMNFGDKFVSRVIWNAAYAQGKENGLSSVELSQYADDITRRCVAGRGPGDLAPALESKWVNIVSPFQIEVNNTWQNVKSALGNKNAYGVKRNLLGLAMFEAVSISANIITNALGIGSLAPSMLEAAADAIEDWLDNEQEDEDEQKTKSEMVGKTAQRLAGEAASYLPFTSLLRMFIDGEDLESILGSESDVTRYGTTNIGLTGVVNAIKNKDVSSLVYGYAFPYGGKQAQRIIEGIKDFGGFNDAGISATYTTDGRLRFPMERTPGNVAKGLLFGKYATKEGKAYIDNGDKPLSEKQTQDFNERVHNGTDPAEAYDIVNMLSDAKLNNESAKDKVDALMSNGFSVEDAIKYSKNINAIKADKDKTGNSVSGSELKKRVRYIYQLDIPAKQKGALYRECIIGADDKKLLLLQAYGVTDAQLAQAYPLLAVTEGTKGANGKTVSGSKNKNISAVLSHIQGLTNVQKDALKVMFMTGKTQEYYEKAMVDALLHSSRLNTAQKKDFYSYYYNNDKRVNVDALREAIMRK